MSNWRRDRDAQADGWRPPGSLAAMSPEILAEYGSVALLRCGGGDFAIDVPRGRVALSSRDLADLLTICLSAAIRTGELRVSLSSGDQPPMATRHGAGAADQEILAHIRSAT